MENKTSLPTHSKQKSPKEPPYASTSLSPECAAGWCFLRFLALICCFPLGVASFVVYLFTRARAHESSPEDGSRCLSGEKIPLREVSASGGDSCENVVKSRDAASSAAIRLLHISRVLAIVAIVFGSILVAIIGVLIGIFLAKSTKW